MTVREKFKRRVVELIHGLPADEGAEIESEGKHPRYGCHPITIGRIITAFSNIQGYEGYEHIYYNGHGELLKLGKV